MDRETIKEKIHYEIAVRNSNFTLAVVTSTGAVSLLLHLKSITEIILFIIGIILSMGFFNGVFKKEDTIEDLIKRFERDK